MHWRTSSFDDQEPHHQSIINVVDLADQNMDFVKKLKYIWQHYVHRTETSEKRHILLLTE
jgi:hypothetical protein